MTTLRSLLAKARALLRRAPSAPASVHRAAPATPRTVSYLLRDAEAPDAADRILVFADGPGATALISFDLPLRALRAAGRVQLTILTEGAFSGMGPMESARAVAAVFDAIGPTIVVASRFGGMGAHAIAEECGARAIPLIAHLDDNLFAVPPELGRDKYERYNDPARLHRMRLLCERAARVYASTAPLKAQLDALGVETPIVAGGIYCAVTTAMNPPRPERASRAFGYMGTAGHAADLEMIAPAIARVLRQHPDARFETFGSIRMPDSLKTEFPDRVIETRVSAPYEQFVEQMKVKDWACGLAPLADTPFNACKANTKFVEYSLAAIPTVASDSIVYRDVCAGGAGVLANDTEAWAAAISRFLTDPAFGAQSVAAAQERLARTQSAKGLETQLRTVLGLTAA